MSAKICVNSTQFTVQKMCVYCIYNIRFSLFMKNALPSFVFLNYERIIFSNNLIIIPTLFVPMKNSLLFVNNYFLIIFLKLSTVKRNKYLKI